ncbi:MAG TPA: MlaD family protein [Thermoleophilaceae bacterium]|jgi:phospholipid/cholesterol/gamma-HCH transport system substrate-binding protein
MMAVLRKNFLALLPLLALAAIGLVVGTYILANQRLRFPIVEDQPIRMKVELPTAQAVTPGQGQFVRVAGVKIGSIGKVELEDGHASVVIEIDRKYEGLIRADATMLLRPKTGLKDMFLEVDPGRGKPLEEGATLRLGNAIQDVNLDEILAMLDRDTREYLLLLIHGAGKGLEGRGRDLREVFRLFEPTHRDLARLNSSVATRKVNLRRLVTALERLGSELAGREDELGQLVSSAARVFRAYASEDRNISAAVRELPKALKQTTRTVSEVERLAEVLGPASEALRAPSRALGRYQRALRPLSIEAEPLLRKEIRPFVREARPTVRSLRPAALDLRRATPNLTRSFVVLNRLFNMAAYNKDGREPPGDPDRDEGYLFYLGWLPHNSATTFATADAHGPFRPSLVAASCQTIRTLATERPESEYALNLTPLLTNPTLCGE